MCRDSTDKTLPKMISIDRSNQGTQEEQMFYKRRTLQELTTMRHGNQSDQVMHQNSNKWYYQSLWYEIRPAWTIHLILVTMKPHCAYLCLLIPHTTQMLTLFFQDFVFTAIATVDRLQENIQWWYMSCDKCHKLATKETENYYCKSCGIYPEKVTPR